MAVAPRFTDLLITSPITIQSIILHFTGHETHFQLINHFLLVFKYYVSNARENGRLELKIVIKNTVSIKEPQKKKSMKENGNH